MPTDDWGLQAALQVLDQAIRKREQQDNLANLKLFCRTYTPYGMDYPDRERIASMVSVMGTLIRAAVKPTATMMLLRFAEALVGYGRLLGKTSANGDDDPGIKEPW